MGTKIFRSKNYNYHFHTESGLAIRWGQTMKDDPEYAPSPEILDIEISTICNNGCPFCYKSNTSTGINMSLDTFKTIINKFPKFKYNGVEQFFLQQIAFGIGSLNTNPDLFKILKYTREIGIIPNLTINSNDNLDTTTAKYLSMVLGACSISNSDKEKCYNKVNLLTSIGMQQINIHQVLCEEYYDKCIQLFNDIKTDERLKNLNAVVLLTLKPKGRGETFHSISKDKFNNLVYTILHNDIKIGFDSCTAFNFMNCLSKEILKEFEEYIDPCESDRMSGYIDVTGRWYHCSFCQGLDGWDGIDMLKINDFDKEVWNNPEVVRFRNKSIENIKNKISCQLFDLNLK